MLERNSLSCSNVWLLEELRCQKRFCCIHQNKLKWL